MMVEALFSMDRYRNSDKRFVASRTRSPTRFCYTVGR